MAIAGTEILVGAPLAISSLGVATGAAYSYSRIFNDSSVVWKEMAKFLDDANATGQCFGSSVAGSDEGLLLFGAAPVQVMELTSGASIAQDLETSAAQVFTFVPSSLVTKTSKGSSSSRPFLMPLVITMGVVLVSIPIVFLAFVAYRNSRESAPISLSEQDEGRGHPELQMSPLQDPAMAGDVERGHYGDSPAGTPQGMGTRQKSRRDGTYKEIGVSEYNGSSIWSSLKRAFVPPTSGESSYDTPQASPAPQSVSNPRFDKKNPMTVPPVATV